MSRRWGLGPVFAYEWLTISRRWQTYAGRALFVGTLLATLAVVWLAQVAGRGRLSIPEQAQVGQVFFLGIVASQLTLVLLAAPAATAGAICMDRARGNLLQQLATDLSDAEIVLGKLAARLVPVIGFVCCTLPVLALATLFGGIDPSALAGAFAVTIALAVLGCSVALAFSVRGTKPHEVLLATYAVWAVWILASPVWEFFSWSWGNGTAWMPRWVRAANPFFLAFSPVDGRDGTIGAIDYAAFVGVALAVSAVLVIVSIRRIRAEAVRDGERRATPRGRRRGRGERRQVPLEGNPVLWYERHRKRLTPWTRNLILLYVGLAVTFAALGIVDSLVPGSAARGWMPAFVNAFLVGLAMPLVLMGASTTLVEERVRGSLDVLLTTPLATREIVLSKWWGVYRRVPPLAVLPALVAAALAVEARGAEQLGWPGLGLLVGYILTAGAAWTSIGLALSTWIPRPGRALAAAVVLHAVIGLAWPIVVLTLRGDYGDVGAGLSAVAPFYGTFYITYSIESPQYEQSYQLVPWTAGWTLCNAALALALLGLVLATFDRSLGRIPDRAQRPRRPAAFPSPEPEPALATR